MTVDNLARVWAYYIFHLEDSKGRLTADIGAPSPGVPGELTASGMPVQGILAHMQPIRLLAEMITAVEAGRLVINVDTTK